MQCECCKASHSRAEPRLLNYTQPDYIRNVRYIQDTWPESSGNIYSFPIFCLFNDNSIIGFGQIRSESVDKISSNSIYFISHLVTLHNFVNQNLEIDLARFIVSKAYAIDKIYNLFLRTNDREEADLYIRNLNARIVDLDTQSAKLAEKIRILNDHVSDESVILYLPPIPT